MLTNRFSLMIALAAIVALGLFAISTIVSPRAVASMSADDQSELQRAANYSAVAARQAYLDQRHEEQTIGRVVELQPASQPFRVAEAAAAASDAQKAYLEYRRGEWNAGVNSALAYLKYRSGEWSGN